MFGQTSFCEAPGGRQEKENFLPFSLKMIADTKFVAVFSLHFLNGFLQEKEMKQIVRLSCEGVRKSSQCSYNIHYTILLIASKNAIVQVRVVFTHILLLLQESLCNKKKIHMSQEDTKKKIFSFPILHFGCFFRSSSAQDSCLFLFFFSP